MYTINASLVKVVHEALRTGGKGAARDSLRAEFRGLADSDLDHLLTMLLNRSPDDPEPTMPQKQRRKLT